MPAENDKNETLRPRRRRLWRIALATGSAVILLALAVFVLPTHAARWLLNEKLEGLGLEVSGVETVDIDLWNREIRFGPMAVGAPGATPARLKHFVLVFSFGALFERRGLGQDAVVEGLVLEVKRDADGRISVNGVDIFDLLRPDTAEPTPEPADADDRWGVGLDRFALRDSQVRFTREDGGELVMEVESLALDGFRTWTPDTSGRFSLSGSLNGMGVAISGEATPFADHIDVTATSEFSAIDFAKVQRFTGKLPLARGEGTMRAVLQHSATLSPDGTIRLTNGGEISVDGLSIALPDGPDIAFGNARVELDTAETLLPDRGATLTGSIAIDGTRARLSLPNGSDADLAQATLRFNELDLASDPQRVLTGSLALTLGAAKGAAHIEGRVVRFDELRFNSKLADASVEPEGRIGATVDGKLTVAAPKLEGFVGAVAKQLSLSLSQVEVYSEKAAFAVGGGLSVDLSDAGVRSDAGPGEVSWSAFAASLNATVKRFDVEAPENAPLSWRASYSFDSAGAKAGVAGDVPGTVAIERLSLEDGAIDSDLQARAERLTVEGASLTADGQAPSPSAAQGGNLSARIARIDLQGAARDADGSVSVRRIAMDKLDANAGGPFHIETAFDSLLVDAFSLSTEAETGVGSAVLSELALSLNGGDALNLKLGELALKDARGSAAPAFHAKTVSLTGLDLAASTALLTEKTPAPSGSEASSKASALPQISIGQFALADPAHLVFTDKRQSPPVSLDARVSNLAVRDLDTAKPDARSAVTLAATINEFTDLSAEGWLSAFGERPNFELEAQIKNLELPTFSRYAAQHLGLNLEKGRLSARANGRMVSGELDMETMFDVGNLVFSPLSPEDAKRLSAAAGVPIETAVGLLEDKDGHIALTIPVKGDFRKPDFQLDQVIGKAVGNAITRTIGTTLKVIFPPALLISAIGSAGADRGIEFAPAPFEPGTATLEPKGRELVDALAKLLRERPKLSVTVCGRSTAADLLAVLAPEIDRIKDSRRADYEQALATYRERLKPLVDRGKASADGKPLGDTPPDAVPQPPAEPVLDDRSIAAEAAAARTDELRDRFTALAAERTRLIRLDLAERGNVAREQVGECRPVYDPQDTGQPRAIVEL